MILKIFPKLNDSMIILFFFFWGKDCSDLTCLGCKDVCVFSGAETDGKFTTENEKKKNSWFSF